MVSASRFIGILAGGCLLCLGLSNCQFNAGPARDTGWPADAIKGTHRIVDQLLSQSKEKSCASRARI